MVSYCFSWQEDNRRMKDEIESLRRKYDALKGFANQKKIRLPMEFELEQYWNHSKFEFGAKTQMSTSVAQQIAQEAVPNNWLETKPFGEPYLTVLYKSEWKNTSSDYQNVVQKLVINQ